jgi:ATP-dependent helicase/DNAse subunit B
MLFGSLVHKTVEKFGLDTAVRDSEDEKVVAESLSRFLDDVVLGMFGGIISGEIRIQVELARIRLAEVAKHQAKSARDGWRIICTEEKHKKKVEVNGTTILVSGVIDRVDVHRDSGRIRVLDYKTGGPTSNETHFKKTTGQWVDLQLPLYRLLLSESRELDSFDKSDSNVSLGYFRIGDQESKTGIDLLELPDGVLDGVDDFIDEILSDIQSGNFADAPTDPAPKYSDDFAWICQDNSIVDESEGGD